MNKKVAIVEDQAHIRLLIEQSIEELEDEDVDILVAPDGESGLQMIIAERPDVVLLDVMMPKMNGFEVCERLRQDPGAKHAYVIFLTAKGQGYDRTHGEQVGANAYFTKPFDPDALLATIRGVLGLDAA